MTSDARRRTGDPSTGPLSGGAVADALGHPSDDPFADPVADPLAGSLAGPLDTSVYDPLTGPALDADVDADPLSDPARRDEVARAWEEMGDEPGDAQPVHVTAVLVAHDGARWLPDTLTALRNQTRPVDHVVAVDAGSRDATPALLRAALPGSAIVTVPARSGFGASVRAGLAHVEPPAALLPRHEWIWLLHDDCAPEPDALERLLAYAATSPSAGILGPKQRDWTDPRRLLEVGITTDAGGRRETGVDRHEMDQGQRDDIRDVLAVGSAGMLVRRDVWEELGGLDPALPLFRDDLDLGWRAALAGIRVVVVPAAVVRHAAAVSRGQRTADAVRRHPARADRRHALYVVLANSSLAGLPLALVRLVLLTLLHVLGLLVTRHPAAAANELLALLGVLGSPLRLLRGRHRRRRLRRVPASEVRPLLAPRTVRLRHLLDQAGDRFSGGAPEAMRAAAIETGPTDDEELLPVGPGRLRRLVTRPGAVLVAALLVVSLVAEHRLLGGGVLAGGRLLPAPDAGGDFWRLATDSWHSTAGGSASPGPPWAPVMAVLSWVLAGRPWLAVDVVVLLAVPLAALSAGFAVRPLTASRTVRLWAAGAWALLPVTLASVGQGRFDTLAPAVLLPLVARVVGRAVVEPAWWRGWTAGLLLALACAFAPPLFPLAGTLLVVLAVATLVAGPRRLRTAGVLLLPILVAPALLLPYLPEIWRSPDLLLVGLGRPGGLAAAPASTPVLDLLALRPGGTDAGPGGALVALALLPAAVAGLVRPARRRLALAGWAAVLVGLLGAVLAVRADAGDGAPGWPGPGLLVAGMGLLVAGAAGATGIRARLTRANLGWRHPVAGVVAVAALAVPLALAAGWVGDGADGPVRRGDAGVLPAFVAADAVDNPGQRVLVVREGPAGAVSYALTSAGGVHLGDGDVAPTTGAARRLGDVVAAVGAPVGSGAASVLGTADVAYVVAPQPVPGWLQAALDSQTGLVRVASPSPVLLWQVQAPTGRLLLYGADVAPTLVSAGDAGPAAGQPGGRVPVPEVLAGGGRTTLPDGPAGRLLVLSEAADPGWRATFDGRPLTAVTAWGWAQAFELPAGGGEVRMDHEAPLHAWLLIGQVIALGVVLLFAVPTGRRDDEPGRLSAPAAYVAAGPGPDGGPDEPHDRGPGGAGPAADGVHERGVSR